MKNTLISIIVPCYNQAQYLDECLQSVLQQTYIDWECIIVNDGSPDDVGIIAKKWQAKDLRFKYIEKENGGVSSARNVGIGVAQGVFILPLDADDKIGMNYIEKAVIAFEENNSLKLVYCRAEKFGDEVGSWNLPNFTLQELSSDNLIFCSALYKKSDWELIGGYDEKMVTGLEDWEFWIALLKNSGEVFKLEDVGFYYRIKTNSRQKDLKNSERKELFEYLSIKHADFFVVQKGSFIALEQEIKLLKKESFKNISNKRIALKVFLKAFFKLDFFK
ncbi:glycosyltransferase family A protein [Flavobacterium sp. LHD-80]|uniref:glycosyltransferase family 2 protein n=1 Tax=Flavobacterium sp. LHD-80 TaxID=3071411 RepID=UPI0027E1EE59|nr:glycosyltransferase family A protein [Flavobacterium sp. LHD-80]MDQ6472079.1 glycosyltransferase family A protein [Flavobacterium sp. LHD-80]